MEGHSREWRVVVRVDGPDGPQWKAAWEDIVPGFAAKSYQSEYEANEAARRLRSTLVRGADGFDAATTDLPV